MKASRIAVSLSRWLLIVDWEDGHHSEYPLTGLRAACPCADSRGGHAGMGAPGSPDMLEIPLRPAQSAELVSLEMVGNYALQPLWKDGHGYGIFSWGYLRALCPCGEHAPDLSSP